MDESLPDFISAIHRAREAGWCDTIPLILVSVARQNAMLRLPSGAWEGPWPVSTSSHGIGNEPGSHRTPWGLHRIAERIGAGAKTGTRFQSRIPVEEIPADNISDFESADLILTRILWLHGLQHGINHSSQERFIYIHGTNHPRKLGSPASHGCIRMCCDDLIRLFDSIAPFENVYCWIDPPASSSPCPRATPTPEFSGFPDSEAP